MKLGILIVGTEIITGRTQDINGSFIARTAHQQGWEVVAILSVGDSFEAIAAGLDFLLPRSEAVVVTGGLGPTADDITTEAIAKFLGRKLILDDDALALIKERMRQRGRPWSSNNEKQALFPTEAHKLKNTVGTAWGFALWEREKIIAVIPGVPAEARQMFLEEVVPLLKRAFPSNDYVLTKVIKLSGISESLVDQRLADIDLMGLSLGYYPRFPELQLVLTARGKELNHLQEKVANALKKITEKLKDYIFAYDDETLEGIVAHLLQERKLTIALAESLTGGLIGDRLTDVPGSSTFFERGIIAYSNRAKIELLSVPPAVINEYGAVSRETAIYMAKGIRTLANTDLGLAVTGIAGPTGGSEIKPVGTVYIALSDETDTYCTHFHFPWERRRNKILTSQWALLILKRYLTEGLSHESS